MGIQKQKWLMGLLGFLALANLATLAAIWFERNKEEPAERAMPHRNGRAIMVSNLQLDSQQARRFDTLRQEHFTTMQVYRREMRDLKDDFFEKLKSPGDGTVDAIAAQIGQQQAKMDLFTFRHFAAIRAMLREDQLSRFDRLVRSLARSIGNGPPPGPRRPHGEEGPEGPPPPHDGPPGGEF